MRSWHTFKHIGMGRLRIKMSALYFHIRSRRRKEVKSMKEAQKRKKEIKKQAEVAKIAQEPADKTNFLSILKRGLARPGSPGV